MIAIQTGLNSKKICLTNVQENKINLKPITIQYELGVVGSMKEVTILSAQEM